jgi:glycosyltransferase involved in cell wall biosynthesis
MKNTSDKDRQVIDISIKTALKLKSNDYSVLEEKFYDFFGSRLDSVQPILNRVFSKTVSIIIPSYNSKKTLPGVLLSISKQKITKSELGLIEVIVIDDGSTDETFTEVQKLELNFKLLYIQQKNFGRSIARNNGAKVATGEIIIFIDSDVLLEQHFIREHMLRHECLEDSVFVGFRDNVELIGEDIQKYVIEGEKPDIKKDPRFFKHIPSDWKRLHRPMDTSRYGDFRVVEETNNLKNFGMDRVLGIWDLPTMVITHSVSIKKNDFIMCGGFSTEFTGWGMEDTFLGASLISLGKYIVPVFSTGVSHIKHEERSGTREQRMAEFHKNVVVYQTLLDKKINDISSKE